MRLEAALRTKIFRYPKRERQATRTEHIKLTEEILPRELCQGFSKGRVARPRIGKVGSVFLVTELVAGRRTDACQKAWRRKTPERETHECAKIRPPADGAGPTTVTNAI